jgi:hypothetical protein
MIRTSLSNKIGKALSYLLIFDHLLSGKKNLSTSNDTLQVARKNVLIYATYTNENLTTNEEELLFSLEKYGYTVVIVNNGLFRFEKWHHLNRKNRGFDLAGIRDAMQLFDGKPKEIVILNNSVIYNTEKTLELIKNAKKLADASNKEIVTCTDSHQTKYHLQSYFFIGIGKGVDDLLTVYKTMKNWRFKRSAVFYGEMSILRKIQFQKSNHLVLFPYIELIKVASKKKDLNKSIRKKIERNVAINPTQDLWMELIEIGAPFIKKNRLVKIYTKNNNRQLLDQYFLKL